MNPKDLVRQLYTDCFTVNTHHDPAAVMGRLLRDDFQSINAGDTKGKAQLIGQIQHFWRIIPDLRWDVQEILQDGDKVIVRSLATGSPKGDFMGLTLDGSRSFKVMTIDIHTVVDEAIQRVHHVEEWATAIRQLKA